jgi:hypothetical protein
MPGAMLGVHCSIVDDKETTEQQGSVTIKHLLQIKGRWRSLEMYDKRGYLGSGNAISGRLLVEKSIN